MMEYFFHKPLNAFCVLLGIAFLLSGCVTLTDVETGQENNGDVIGVINEKQVISQSFVSRRPRVNSITVWVRPEQAQQPGENRAELTVELYHSLTETTPFFSSSFSVVTGGPVRAQVDPRPGPADQLYILTLKSTGSLQVLGSQADSYPGGQAYIAGQPAAGDIAFSTTYDYDTRAVLNDLANGLGGAWLALPLAVTLLAPGWLILDLSGLRKKFDNGEQLALSIGLSLAIIPILMLWTTTIGLHWSRLSVLFAGGILSAIVLWRGLRRPLSFHFSWMGAALGAILLFTLAQRLIMVRDLSAPAWVDSVHHALITRLILENGSFPSTYAPYANLPATQYHAGFHSGLAVFTWLSGLSIPSAMLIYGQILNAAAAAAVYLFTTTLTRSRLAALFAALVTSVVTPMPAYLASWGRYTELAGLLLIPPAFSFIKILVEERDTLQKKERYSLWILAILACAGILLVHYRVVVFIGCLLLPYFLSRVQMNRRENIAIARKVVTTTLVIGLGSILLTLPWTGANIARLLLPALSHVQSARPRLFSDFSWRFLTVAFGNVSLYGAGFGLLFSLFKLKRFAFILVFWILLMLLVANFSALGIPGGWLMNNISVEILFFIPLSVLCGYLISQLIIISGRYLPARWHRPAWVGLAASAMVFAFFAARSLMTILNPGTELFRLGDRTAMNWIEKNIPADKIILINSFQWGSGLYAGNDGGYWISPLTGRSTMPPPALYGFGSPSDIQHINTVSKEASSRSANAQDLWSYLLSQDIQYIYIGERGGQMKASTFLDVPLYQMVYHDQGVWVFKLLTKP